VPQLNHLRGAPVKWKNVPLNNTPKTFELPQTNAMEISIGIDLPAGQSATFTIKNHTSADSLITLTLSDSQFKMPDAESALPLSEKKRPLRLRIFIDHSVLEAFVNDEICATKVINPLSGNETLEISTPGVVAKARLIEVWPMKTIWE
jgi:sucrose-6-phosphate hydrolase SacC (GH32 family)